MWRILSEIRYNNTNILNIFWQKSCTHTYQNCVKKNNQITYTYNCTFALTHPSLLSTNNQNILLVCVLWDQRKTFNGNKSEKKTINKNVNKAFLIFARFFIEWFTKLHAFVPILAHKYVPTYVIWKGCRRMQMSGNKV